jgi:hypothetical protein
MSDSADRSAYPDAPSVLNATDRAYLLGEHDPKDEQADRDRRQRIRDRARIALADFELLFQELPRHDRELLFKRIPPADSGIDGLLDLFDFTDPTGQAPPGEDADISDPFVEAAARYVRVVRTIAFLYCGCRDLDVPVEDVLELAIRQGETARIASPFGVKDVTLDITYYAEADPDAAAWTISTGEALSDGAYYALVNLFHADIDRFVDLLGGIDAGVEATLEAGEELTRGQALVLLARTWEDSSVAARDGLAEQLPQRVMRDFGLRQAFAQSR